MKARVSFTQGLLRILAALRLLEVAGFDIRPPTDLRRHYAIRR